jgi:crotonobetainyl-CoA:carnitine CoA-transferase CaiB-like acyl-CoA transferase
LAPDLRRFSPNRGTGSIAPPDGRLLSLSVAHEDRFWEALCRAAGLDDVAGLGAQERRARREELVGRLAAAIELRTLNEWVETLAEAPVAFAPVLALDEVAEDPRSAIADRSSLSRATARCRHGGMSHSQFASTAAWLAR